MPKGRTSTEQQEAQREVLKAWVAMKTETGGSPDLVRSWTPLEVAWRAYLLYSENVKSVPFSGAKWRKELVAEHGLVPKYVLGTLCLPLTLRTRL